jgi:pyruvate-formate lyase
MGATTDKKSDSPWKVSNPVSGKRDQRPRFYPANYKPYEGDASFLAPATNRTKRLWDQLNKLFVEERKKGVLDVSQIPPPQSQRTLPATLIAKMKSSSAIRRMHRSSGPSCPTEVKYPV